MPWFLISCATVQLKTNLHQFLLRLIYYNSYLINSLSNLYESAIMAVTKFYPQKTDTIKQEEKFWSMCHCILMYLYEVLVTE